MHGNIDAGRNVFLELLGEGFRELHFPAQHQARDILGPVGDSVLGGNQLQQIMARDRHKQALGDVSAHRVLEFVRLPLERDDFLLRGLRFLPVTLLRRVNERRQALGGLEHLVHVLLDRSNR